MLHPNFVLLGSILFFVGSASYIIETIRGKVKPNRVTWFLWALAPLIAFFAQRGEGVGMQSLFTLTVGLVPAVVFIASFVNKKSYWKVSKLDVVCGCLSLIGLILWQITKVGNIALILSIVADLFAAFPTVVKSYHEPETENYILYLANAISAGLTLLTITVWDFAQYAFSLYILVITLLLAGLIKFKIGKLITKIVINPVNSGR